MEYEHFYSVYIHKKYIKRIIKQQITEKTIGSWARLSSKHTLLTVTGLKLWQILLTIIVSSNRLPSIIGVGSSITNIVETCSFNI